MKRKILVLISLMMVIALAAGCATTATPTAAPTQTPSATGQGNAEDRSWTDIEQKGYFIVGLDDSFPPMGFRDSANNIVGFDIDFANEVASRLGVEARFQPVVWDFIGEELNTKKVDLIWNGCTITEARQKVFDFTDPYLQNKQVVVVKNGSSFKTLADLAGKKVGIQGGSSANHALDANADFKASLGSVSEYPDNAKALTDLEIGRVDAVIVDVCVYAFYLTEKPDAFEKLEEDLGSELFGVGIRKNEGEFLRKLQAAMDEIVADGTAQTIVDKWFGEGEDILAK